MKNASLRMLEHKKKYLFFFKGHYSIFFFNPELMFRVTVIHRVWYRHGLYHYSHGYFLLDGFMLILYRGQCGSFKPLFPIVQKVSPELLIHKGTAVR